MIIHTYHSSSAGNLYQVGDILIDPGVPIREIKRKLDYRLCDITACLCGHGHLDHSRGLKDLTKCGVDVYANVETLQHHNINGHRGHIIRSKEPFQAGSWSIMPFTLIHNVPTLGFLLESESKGVRVLYICDTMYVPFQIRRGAHYILAEVNYHLPILKKNIKKGLIDISLGKKIVRNHMSLDTAKGFFKANDMSRVREIHLLHLSHANSDADLFKREIQKITGRPVYISSK